MQSKYDKFNFDKNKKVKQFHDILNFPHFYLPYFVQVASSSLFDS